ncbi:MAG: PorP/SprF family type IX secretion system membrane protein [Bacteroidales bacterium]|nr:PorP/SprF family type IX secretion system membrane protein [Bacteroidales bacterium]
MIRLSKIFIIVALLLTNYCLAQQFPLSNQYIINPYSLSPSYAGIGNSPELFANFRRDWSEIEGAPKTSYASLFVPVNERVWLGGSIINDQTDIISNISANFSYTYHLKAWEEHNFSFSLWGSIYHSVIDLTDVIVKDANDPVIYGKQKLVGTSLNAGTSILYNYKKLYTGIVIPTLVSKHTITDKSNNNRFLVRERSLIFHVSSIIDLDDYWYFEPYFVLRSTKYSPSVFDLAFLIKNEDKYWFGVLLRKGGILGINIGATLAESLVLNYSYEFSAKGMLSKSSGTHEFSIGYYIYFQAKEPKARKWKSIYPYIID